MVGSGAAPRVTRWKDGREWRIGSDADVAWIRGSTPPGLSITSAVPAVFASYATVLVPNEDEGRAADLDLLLRVLNEQSPDQQWWLGYLETGADDVVFTDAPRVTLYSDWQYVLVQATPAQAARWRHDLESWRAPGPDLLFRPTARGWCRGSGTTTGAAWEDHPRSSTGSGPAAVAGATRRPPRGRHATGARGALTPRPCAAEDVPPGWSPAADVTAPRAGPAGRSCRRGTRTPR